MTINVRNALVLSDGTPVEFVKETSKGNVQVRLPYDHAFASDPLRIFRPDGSHYKDNLDGLTLLNADGAVATDALVRGTPEPEVAAAQAKAVDPRTIATVAPAVVGVINFVDLGADGKFGIFRLPS